MNTRHTAREIYTNPIYFLAYGLGSGLAPRAPGTAGTLVGVIIYLLLTPVPDWLYWLITAVLFVIGIFVCGYTARKLGVEDPGAANWDEVVGYLLTMTVLPQALLMHNGWLWIVLGFILFRIFDILKPWPIRWFDRNIGGGFGIMLDDLVAAIPAAVVLYILRLVFPGL